MKPFRPGSPGIFRALLRSEVLAAVVGLVILLHALPSPLHAEPENQAKIQPARGEYADFVAEGDIRRFAGETLYFDISFLWFKNAASAEMGFYEKDGDFYAVLKAQTKGFLGFFTSYRLHIYEARFEVIEDGRRVRPNQFTRQVIVGDKIEKSLHMFDYSTRKHWWFEYVNDEVVETGKEDIPKEHDFDDVLTVFYNFRNGAYGPLQKGSRYTVKTIPEKGEDTIHIEILGGKEEDEYKNLKGKNSSKELVIDIIVPRKVFVTKSGKLRFWSSQHYIPVESTVKDYILLGDLHVRLRRREFREGAQATTPPKSHPDDKGPDSR